MQLVRRFIAAGSVVIFALLASPAIGQARVEFDLETATVADINRAIDHGALNSERLVQLSLARIRSYEPTLHAIITLNEHALEEARALDAERKKKGRRSPLHGIPVLLKDNINTHDLPTTLGFYGLDKAVPHADAVVVARLREAGAIILAKTNLSELASGPPLSSLGGQTRNPHNLAYSPAGSSSGSAVGVAAGYAPIGIATDTTGSARWPAATNGIVGLRPTTGTISTAGVQPSAPTLDAVGPMARSIADAALVLGLLQNVDYQLAVTPTALDGARIGFPRKVFSGDDPEMDAAMNAAIDVLKAGGASVVDVDFPDWLIPLSGDLQAILVRTESVPSLDAYLDASFAPGLPRTHAEILAMSEKLVAATPAGATPNPGRIEGYRWAAGAGPMTSAVYLAARDQGRELLRDSLRAVFIDNRLDAIVYPTQTRRINKLDEAPKRNARRLFGNFGAVLASLAGWPELTVPAGITSEGLPVGVSLLAPERKEQRLLDFGHAFEQRGRFLRQPVTTPPLAGEQFAYEEGSK